MTHFQKYGVKHISLPSKYIYFIQENKFFISRINIYHSSLQYLIAYLPKTTKHEVTTDYENTLELLNCLCSQIIHVVRLLALF